MHDTIMMVVDSTHVCYELTPSSDVDNNLWCYEPSKIIWPASGGFFVPGILYRNIISLSRYNVILPYETHYLERQWLARCG